MKRLTYRILAIVCIVLGIIGALLPIMPTVPFLLAALYFAADEPQIQSFINSNGLLKKYLASCQGTHPLKLYEKVFILCGLWFSMVISICLLAGKTHWQIVLAVIGVVVSIYILRIKNIK
ncbi:MAG: YbaN family protein [Lentisphaeria bacterium]|nr:YbaN family protein [Lentisphaeria bacterium]